MGIVRPGKDTPSFDEFRRKRSPKGGFFGDTEDPSAQTKEAEAHPPAAEAPTPAQTSAAPVKTTAPEPKPKPKVAAPAGPVPVRPAAIASPAPADVAPAPEPAPATSKGETILLKARLAIPAQGHSAKFDQAAAVYGDKSALQLLLAPALTAYSAAIQAGTIGSVLPEYPRGEGSIQISRAISPDVYEKARAILDPMALFPPGKLAAAICRQALSHSLAAG